MGNLFVPGRFEGLLDDLVGIIDAEGAIVIALRSVLGIAYADVAPEPKRMEPVLG